MALPLWEFDFLLTCSINSSLLFCEQLVAKGWLETMPLSTYFWAKVNNN